MVHFNENHLRLARIMHDLGLRRPPEPGAYFFDMSGNHTIPSPFQSSVYLIVDCESFLREVGGLDRFLAEFCWLPVWEDGCAWLTERGVPIKHIYYTVKEGVLFYEEEERELLYGEIIRILEIEAAERNRSAQEKP